MNEELTREELELAEAGEEMLEEEGAMIGEECRNIETITAEIRFFKRQAAESICEIGMRLIEAKTQLSHGEWLPWLRDEVDFSEASAQRYMRLAREYGKSVTVTDLGASKALILLGLPASEREEFIAETHEVNGTEKSVSEMTKKELEQAIRERDEAQKALEEERSAGEGAAMKIADLQSALEKANEEAGRAIERAEDAEQTVKEFSEENVRLTDDLAEAERRVKELEERPVEVAVQEKDASAEQIEAARAEARAAALEEVKEAHAAEIAELKSNKQAEVQRADRLAEEKKKLTEKLRAAEEKAKASASAGSEEKEKLTAEIEALKKQLSMSGAEVTAFKIKFSEWQEAYNAMRIALDCLAPEQREKCEAAIRAVLEGWNEVEHEQTAGSGKAAVH